MANFSIPDYSKSNVLIVGDVMLDLYWKGNSNRISPEAPVPVVKVENKEFRPGGAANVALNISALGAACTLVGMIGKDDNGRILMDKLHKNNVQTEFALFDNYPTITKLRVLSRGQQLIRLDFEEGFGGVDQAPVLAIVRDQVKKVKVVVCSDYAKGTLISVQTMIKMAREAGCMVLVDPKGTDFERYRGATLLTPNMNEFEAVVGKTSDEHDILDKGLRLIHDYGIEALLITRSENGMTLIRKGKPVLNLPAEAREVYDVTGAGDTVIGTLAASLAAGTGIDRACAIANHAAGIVVGKVGTSTVTIDELKNDSYNKDELKTGVVTEPELLKIVSQAKKHGEKIVMTNGCFDIIHAGHVAYLKEAAALGDRLIVAVNTDDSVAKLKGPERPINSLKDRLEVLSSLSSVDWVVPFSEDTPRNLIAKVLPDILVKGGDYRPEDIAGYKEVTENGGEVKILSFVKGCSTSNIIKKIRENTKS